MAWLALALLVGTTPGFARECPPLSVQAAPGLATDEQRVCDAGGQAARFLGSTGIGLPAVVAVQIVDTLPDFHGVHTYGNFDAKRDQVRVLSFAASRTISGKQQPFGVALDERMYQSIVVHELTHALIDGAFAPGCASLRAHEYIAYVTQLATMAPTLRQQIVEAYALPPFADREISDLYYHLDPQAFGVKAWLHFAGPSGGADFVKRLLDCNSQPDQQPR